MVLTQDAWAHKDLTDKWKTNIIFVSWKVIFIVVTINKQGKVNVSRSNK